MNKKKKSKTIYLYFGIIVLLIGGLILMNVLEPKDKQYGVTTSKLNPATRDQLKDPNYQNIILPATLDEKIANKEDFFLYVFSSTCPFCKETTPKLIPIVKEMNIDMPQLNLQEFAAYRNKLKIEYTPTLVYFKDGQEAERMEGGIKLSGMQEGYTEDQFREFFNKHSGNN